MVATQSDAAAREELQKLNLALALKDDLTHVRNLLKAHTEGPVLDYVAQFVGGLAVSAGDTTLLSAARALDTARSGSGETQAALGQLTTLLRDRMAEPRAM